MAVGGAFVLDLIVRGDEGQVQRQDKQMFQPFGVHGGGADSTVVACGGGGFEQVGEHSVGEAEVVIEMIHPSRQRIHRVPMGDVAFVGEGGEEAAGDFGRAARPLFPDFPCDDAPRPLPHGGNDGFVYNVTANFPHHAVGGGDAVVGTGVEGFVCMGHVHDLGLEGAQGVAVVELAEVEVLLQHGHVVRFDDMRSRAVYVGGTEGGDVDGIERVGVCGATYLLYGQPGFFQAACDGLEKARLSAAGAAFDDVEDFVCIWVNQPVVEGIKPGRCIRAEEETDVLWCVHGELPFRNFLV